MRVIMAEVFNSWQGEGGSVEGSAFGRRQIFVRFAGCDLHCLWCDSKEYIDASRVSRWRYEVEPSQGDLNTGLTLRALKRSLMPF